MCQLHAPVPSPGEEEEKEEWSMKPQQPALPLLGRILQQRLSPLAKRCQAAGTVTMRAGIGIPPSHVRCSKLLSKLAWHFKSVLN